MRYLIHNELPVEQLVINLHAWCEQQGNIFGVRRYEDCYPENLDIAIIDVFGELSEFQLMDLQDSLKVSIESELPDDSSPTSAASRIIHRNQ